MDRGSGTPKDRDEVYKREVCECDGRVCDLDAMGEFVIPNLDLRCEEKTVCRKWN